MYRLGVYLEKAEKAKGMLPTLPGSMLKPVWERVEQSLIRKEQIETRRDCLELLLQNLKHLYLPLRGIRDSLDKNNFPGEYLNVLEQNIKGMQKSIDTLQHSLFFSSKVEWSFDAIGILVTKAA